MDDPTFPAASPAETATLEAAVDKAIASCDGDARAAVRSLMLALHVYEAELAALRTEVARIEAAVSPGCVRGRLGGSRREVEGEA